MIFGEFVRYLRGQKKLKLREFCSMYGHDPSNWSKLERGELLPPESRNTLEDWAHQLGLAKETDEWYRFFDLAYQERGKIPADLLSDEKIVETLPLFFRTMRGQKPTDEELNQMIELLKRS